MPLQDFIRAARDLAGWIFLVPAVAGTVYSLLSLATAAWWRMRNRPAPVPSDFRWPAVSLLKPVHGLEKHLERNLRSACTQDYPDYQVVFSVEDENDEALPILRKLELEFGAERVTVAVERRPAGPNGKINNTIGALAHARHDTLVISDSDVRLQPDYLKTIVPPLADPANGCACTLYKAACANRWFEKIELLTLNADFMPNVVFAHVTGASRFLLGASTALTRTTLREIGGLESLADYLVEDYEMGRRVLARGRRIQVLGSMVDTMVDLKDPAQWWGHQVYWDQNNRAARPLAYFATALIKSVPFAFLYALVRAGSPFSLLVSATALGVRMITASLIMGWAFRDREGLASIWLLPLRDLLALVSWLLAYTQRTTTWRGKEFTLTRDGRLVARTPVP